MTNREAVLLSVLRKQTRAIALKDLARLVEETLICPRCDGSGEGSCGFHGCCECYGRGRSPFHYSDAYYSMMKLLRAGLVSRFHPRDMFGDELPTYVWTAEAPPEPGGDPLEALYSAPSAER